MEDVTVTENYTRLQTQIAEYFSDLSQDELKKDLFPKHPELFSVVAEKRGYGIPWQYKKATETYKVNERMFFFESNLGKQYTGNPRYIYERMLERFPEFTYVWCYSGQGEIPGDPIIVERASGEYYKLLAQSRFIINNTTFPLWYHRPETFYLQTWHGTPFKRLHWDITSRPLERRSTPEFYVKSKKWDALLSPNPYSTEKFRSAFRYDGEIIEYGYPANDIFYHKDRYRETRKKIREKVGILDDKTPVYLYAPTWRDGKHLGNAMFEFELMLDPEKFLKHAPKGSVLLIRSHHMSSSEDKLSKLSGRVVNVSDWDDAIELMCAADVLITDYSSIVFDWYCSRKPVLYYVPDYEQYVGPLRGSYFELKDNAAGVVCETEEELFRSLSKAAKQKTTSYSDFYASFCSVHNGNSADRVIDYLLSR
jgi:CDP-glycerol glycerophosphotransferase (TagB/SpsB family)